MDLIATESMASVSKCYVVPHSGRLYLSHIVSALILVNIETIRNCKYMQPKMELDEIQEAKYSVCSIFTSTFANLVDFSELYLRERRY